MRFSLLIPVVFYPSKNSDRGLVSKFKVFFKSIRAIDLIVWVLSTFTYFYVFKYVQQDIKAHAIILQKTVAMGSFPIPPLYYAVLFICSGFAQHLFFTISVAFVLLGIATTLKFKITTHYLKSSVQQGVHKNMISFLGVAMLVVMSIVSSKNLYIGELSSNVWHNSTTIFLLPFSLLLFLVSGKIIKQEVQKREAYLYLILIVVNALIKPSFLFVFAFLPIVYFLFHGWNKTTRLFILGSFIAVSIVVLEYTLLFLLGKDSYAAVEQQEKSSIIIQPFHVWKHYSSNIGLSILSGIAFPLSVLIGKFKQARKNFMLVFAWVQVIVAVIIYALFTETGYRMYDGNLAWQIIPSMYLLFTMSLVFLFNEFRNENNQFTRSGKIIFSIFLLHFVSGVVYLCKLYFLKEYH